MRALFIFAFLNVLYISQTAQANVVKVYIYYEALCPDSVNFIVGQLATAYPIIGSNIDIEFVPYGNAEHHHKNGKWTFECQHKEAECYANKAQACGLAKRRSQIENVNYINCLMSQAYPQNDDAIAMCAAYLNSSGRSILKCAKGRKGDELLAKHGDRTQGVRPAITSVPTIIFNDVYDANLQAAATNNFLATVCNMLNPKPYGCPLNYEYYTNYQYYDNMGC